MQVIYVLYLFDDLRNILNVYKSFDERSLREPTPSNFGEQIRDRELEQESKPISANSDLPIWLMVELLSLFEVILPSFFFLFFSYFGFLFHHSYVDIFLFSVCLDYVFSNVSWNIKNVEHLEFDH